MLLLPVAEVRYLDALLASIDARRDLARREIDMLDELQSRRHGGLIDGTLALISNDKSRTGCFDASSEEERPGSTAGHADMADLHDTLWKAADKLRGSMDAAQYKDFVLGLVFLKYVSDSFDERREQIRAERPRRRGARVAADPVPRRHGRVHRARASSGCPRAPAGTSSPRRPRARASAS